jgi:hypothetical protein
MNAVLAVPWLYLFYLVAWFNQLFKLNYDEVFVETIMPWHQPITGR